jgi:hypothetical protein
VGKLPTSIVFDHFAGIFPTGHVYSLPRGERAKGRMPTERPAPIAPGPLLAVSRRLLRPLVRLMIQNGVTLPILNEMLRGLFVEVTAHEILTDPKARTDSRISLSTGIHRKEVRRLRDLPLDRPEVPDVVTVSSQIIARWLASEPYVGADGHSLPLPRGTAAEPVAPSFESLVQSVTSDIRARAVLDDWLSKGIVSIDAADRIVLNADAFIPRPGAAEQLFYFGRNLHDHVAAAAANISAAEKAPFLDRSVHYDGMTAAQADELEAFARDAASKLLLEVNRRAASMVEASTGGAPADRRVNFGVYVFSDEDRLDAGLAASGGSAAA